jgi:glycosyltransferase involved in cell wall biosynthesis
MQGRDQPCRSQRVPPIRDPNLTVLAMTHPPLLPDDMPVVSVLMPCFNHESYVVLALNSIAASTYESIELVIIDDCSIDGSFDLVQSWSTENANRFTRVIIKKHTSNRGISATLNELISHATGQYITFLASDDLLVSDGIAKQVERAVERQANYVFADAVLIDEQGSCIAESALTYHGRNPNALTRKSCLTIDVLLNWEAPWTRIFIHTNLLRRLGMFDESLLFEDRDFVVRVLIADSFTFISDPVYVYRMRIGNRLTPGLDAGGMRADYQRSEAKNYQSAKGLIRGLLWLNVMAGKVRFDADGQEIKSRTWPLFAILRRIITRAHLTLMSFQIHY